MNELKFIMSSENVLMHVYYGKDCVYSSEINSTLQSNHCQLLKGDSLNPVVINQTTILTSDADYFIVLYSLQPTTLRLELELYRNSQYPS